MEPYWTDGQVTLYLGDCREILPTLGRTADCVVADPPYGETTLRWDRWPDGWLDAAAGITRSLWCFGSLRMYLKHAHEFAGWSLSQDVIWEKHHGSGIARDRFRRVHEQPSHWYQGSWRDIYHETPRTKYAGPDSRHGYCRSGSDGHTGELAAGYRWTDDGTRLQRSVIKARGVWRRGAIHPTEKPVDLLTSLIEYACPPGGLVIDPMEGSGSTLDAARLSGRRAIGVEIHEPYAEAAARRLSQGALIA